MAPLPHDPYAADRLHMLEHQLRPRGIVLHSVLDAMRQIPRHLFVSHAYSPEAYADRALPSLEGQTISQPYIVAIMTQELALRPGLRILEIGTGTGYQTAILAHLTGPTGLVCTIERLPALATFAQHRLAALHFTNIRFLTADGTTGWPTSTQPNDIPHVPPFDRILITAGTPAIPPPLLDQLADPGILVAPVGNPDSQTLTRLSRHHAHLTQEPLLACRFVPLLGQHAWK